jgi:tetrapyrrole methylase family protein/MazG family protein
VPVTADVTILGLGPGDPALITRQAWTILESADEVYLRTRQHGTWTSLPTQPALHSFDELYERLDRFDEIYRAIVDRLLELARRPRGVVYAVPGDPTVGEAAVPELRRRAAEAGLSLELVHGVSFVEPTLALVGLDALEGLQLADAVDLALRHHPAFTPDQPALIGQLHSRLLASDVKLTLMNQYPGDHPVHLVQDAGSPSARLETLALHALDQRESFGLHSCLVVPPLPRPSSFEAFQEIIAHLRAPDGCPWDREQTPESLRPHLLEEAYEALQAIDEGDSRALREELGDLLLQIVLQAQIAGEAEAFSMADVVGDIAAKIVRRHPHVFSGLEVHGVEEVLHNWEGLKEAERQAEGGSKGLLDGVPPALPALAQAVEVQGRVARVGFDWPDAEGARLKILEELGEVQRAPDDESRADEVGDLLFAAANYARKLEVDPEAALRQANARFRRRFAQVEDGARRRGRSVRDMTLADMDALWEAAKGAERTGEE